MSDTVRVQSEDFNVGAESDRLRLGNPSVGAIASFIGTVRDVNEGSGVSELCLEHYPGMTEQALLDIASEARSRWRLIDTVIIHRVGPLRPTDQIVLVMVSSAHRGDAFAACQFIMDYLKTRAPFWKKERTSEGSRWVEARESDDQAAARWVESRESDDQAAARRVEARESDDQAAARRVEAGQSDALVSASSAQHGLDGPVTASASRLSIRPAS